MGKVPSDVQLKNVHLAAVLPNNSVLCNFWMNVENFEVVEENVYHSEDVWFQFMRSVSQAAPARRLNIKKPTKLDWFNGSGSGDIFQILYSKMQLAQFLNNNII